MTYSRRVSKRPEMQSVTGFVFWLYIYFVIDFFLHLSARIPSYGVIRPTLLLVIIITGSLFMQRDKFQNISQEPAFKSIKRFIIYVIVSLPLITWPGSVVANNFQLYLKAIVFFFFTAMIIDTEKRLTIFLFVYIGCQVFRVLEPLYLNITEGYWGSKTYLGYDEFAQRLSGAPADVINPNGLGFVIATIIPFLHYLLWMSDKKFYKLIYVSVLPAVIYALILTMSRGSFIALLVVVWMLFKKSRHKGMMIVIIISAMIAGWINMSDIHKDRYLSLFDSNTAQSASAEGRITGIIDEFWVALERPVVGHGLGTSREAKAHAGIGWMISHNLYLEVWMEVGIIGFIIFFLFIKSAHLKLTENLLKIEELDIYGTESYVWRLSTALKAVFWMYVVYSFNYFGLSTYYWYLLVGLVVAFSRIYFSEGRIKGIKDATIT